MSGLVSLRPIDVRDLPIFFEHQLDAEACRLAAFPARDHAAFMHHWMTKILGRPNVINRTVLLDGRVAGHIGAWTDAGTHERLLGYWLGREFWGRGVASAAAARFLQCEVVRPLTARVAQHNLGSIRVLEKVGFKRTGADVFSPSEGTLIEEFVYVLPT